ncbi:hypothetical protein [Nostoc flagelliforme]|uniref:hypothetical protein n=1 Tax=Nostoc flagelliforme TaxID=1306274 RepID=UPI0012FE5237|nr:hypothetical protein [Nostoc flagelliforme]
MQLIFGSGAAHYWPCLYKLMGWCAGNLGFGLHGDTASPPLLPQLSSIKFLAAICLIGLDYSMVCDRRLGDRLQL